MERDGIGKRIDAELARIEPLVRDAWWRESCCTALVNTTRSLGARARILFVVDAPHSPGEPGNGSNRYRCHHPAEALRAAGHRASVVALAQVDRPTIAAHDVVSVLRPRWTRQLARLLERCAALEVITCCDFDDLLFDPSLASFSPRVINGFAGRRATAGEFRSHRRALRAFDTVTVSTQALARAASRVHPKAHVIRVPNGMSSHWLANRTPVDAASSDLLSYLPGTRSHDHDMQLILPALARTLVRHPSLTLRVVGPLSISPGSLPAGRIEQVERVDYYRLPGHLAAATASLAPLTDNLFNAAKSRVKVIESLAYGTPLVATPNTDLPIGTEGLELAVDSEDWDAAIERALEIGRDAARRRRIAKAARQRFTATRTVEPFTRWLQSRSAGPANYVS